MTEPETIVQGSPEWRELRLGKITASEFYRVLPKPKSGSGLSKSAEGYMLDLLAEILTGQEQGFQGNWATQWGKDNEPAARELYEEVKEVEVQKVGFITHPDEPMIGGSPDGLVGENGGIEIKCPGNTRIHLGYMLGGVLPTEHMAQVQGHIWNSGRQWWDFVSYDPRIKGPDTLRLALWVHRVERDEPYIKTLEKAVFAFRDRLLETLIKLKIGVRV